MIPNVYSVTIGGQAGQGVKSSGLMLAKLAARAGLHVYNHVEYPSLIKGGHNVMQINFSTEEVLAPQIEIDVLIALNSETIKLHSMQLKSNALVISSDKYLEEVPETVKHVKIPLSGFSDLQQNIISLGALVYLFGANIESFKIIINEEFSRKGDKVVTENMAAFDYGYKFAQENYPSFAKDHLTANANVFSAAQNMLLNGCDAAALGAMSANMQFASIYPMSPISGILQTLALYQDKADYRYVQPEDEPSAINMAIGASYAGLRSMTATSGGGFCLMTEGYGLAGMTETPLVIILGMRGGPATGLPTWSEQGDLRFVISAHQGDFPRIVLAASDVKDTYELTRQAFKLADRYQTPVVVLLDKNICDNEQTVGFLSSRFESDKSSLVLDLQTSYARYANTTDGISPRSIPGTGNFFIANADEHDSYGYSSEDEGVRSSMMLKRMKKLETCAAQDMAPPQIYGPENASTTLVSWGSTKGAILTALKDLPDTNYIHVTWLNPFPTTKLTELLKKAQRLVGIENNFSGQLCDLIREKTGILLEHRYLKYTGRPIYSNDIVDFVKGIK